MIFFGSLTGAIAQAQNQTPDYWKCEERVGGTWAFGVGPDGCKAGVFGEDRYIFETYQPLIFDESVSIDKERLRYMDELAAVIREASALYIKKRNPQVSAAEQLSFVHAALTVAHQESFWTHYRKVPNQSLKMMRGDFGHGHGLMQVDDRWHFIAVNEGRGWSLVKNIIYSLEEYYDAWVRAATVNCVTDTNDFRMRARAAYSAYNGGISKICRWTNPDDRWARNDNGFVTKYDKQAWLSYVKDPNKISQVNVPCLLDGQENCPLRPPRSEEDVPRVDQIYQNSSFQYCFYREGGFQCIADSRDLACLQRLGNIQSNSVVRMSKKFEAREKKTLLDRHQLCVEMTDFRLKPVGAIVRVKKDTNLRATPAGAPKEIIKAGTSIQVIDFEVRDMKVGHRYYMALVNGSWGYFYGGSLLDDQDWAEDTSESPKNLMMAQPGQRVRIISKGGINLRDEIGGTILANIPNRAVVKVEKRIVRATTNDLYYFVDTGGRKGFIYSGRAFPLRTYPQWSAVER